MNSNISMTIYTPGGFRGYFTMVFDDPSRMMTATELEAHLAGLGYQPAAGSAEALSDGEFENNVGFVLLRNYYDQEKGTTTPIVAMYKPHNETYSKKVVHKYMNTPEDIAEFEAVSGLKVDALPVFPGDNYPDRDDASKRQYFVEVKTSFSVVTKKVDPKPGEQFGRVFLQRYMTANGTPPAPTVTIGNGGSASEWWKDSAALASIKPRLDKVKADIGDDEYAAIKARLNVRDYAVAAEYAKAFEFEALSAPVGDIPF